MFVVMFMTCLGFPVVLELPKKTFNMNYVQVALKRPENIVKVGNINRPARFTIATTVEVAKNV